MKALNFQYKKGEFYPEPNNETSNLTICFGSKTLLEDEAFCQTIMRSFPAENMVMLTTAGEIFNSEVLDDSLSITTLKFDATPLSTHSINIKDFKNSTEAGIALVQSVVKEDLRYVMVFSDGGLVNGSDLVAGMRSVLDENVLITGGLAGNGSQFSGTLVGLNKNPKEGVIVAIGFYGSAIKIGHGSFGGWDTFGLERTVTKSEANILHEIDGKNALELYKTYLGNYADSLPSSALLFPLSLRTENSDDEVVRTILSIDKENQSMVFAGNIPVGGKVRFMKANFDNLIDAAGQAAQITLTPFGSNKPKYALLISCVGRKLVLKERIEEEVEAVREILGEDCVLSGFYSYGEITPINNQMDCKLHNQTMTITCFDEWVD